MATFCLGAAWRHANYANESLWQQKKKLIHSGGNSLNRLFWLSSYCRILHCSKLATGPNSANHADGAKPQLISFHRILPHQNAAPDQIWCESAFLRYILFFLYFFLTLSELEELKPPQLSNFHFPDWQIDSDWNSCEQLVNWSDWDDDEISGPECPKWQWKSNKYRVLKYWEMWKMMLLQRKSFMRK